jgi:hypothetical protein
MECIIAKIFGSEGQKEAAIELCMKTHGGRSFLHGHLFGDNVHEFLAPCIYEGEGEMLGMAFFKSLIKHHGMEFFEPIGKQLAAAGIRKPNMADPRHAWVLREPLTRYARWYMRSLVRRRRMPSLPAMPTALRSHAEWAIHWLEKSRFEISGVLRKHQLKLADRQCRMAEISARVQSAIIVLATALYAGQQKDELVQQAGDMLCRDTRRALTGQRSSDGDLRAAVALGARVAEGNFSPLAGVTPQDVLMPYLQ